ncbi:MAG: hypothetical protein Ta2A_09660 [Treponemataceae bacterium]|nr:MAG: hypothetical protein Ta2A_09660 [Treponemataceae bacterium]
MKNNFGFMLSAGAVSLLLVFTGCGGGKKAAANAIDAEIGPVGRYKEPLVLTWGVNSSSVQKFIDGDTYEDNVWSRKIKEDLNIDVQIAFTANWETQAYQQQVNLALASGSIPDLLRLDNYRQFREAVDAGLLADITDAFEKYASPELKALREKYASSFEYVTVTGGSTVFRRLTATSCLRRSFGYVTTGSKKWGCSRLKPLKKWLPLPAHSRSMTPTGTAKTTLTAWACKSR